MKNDFYNYDFLDLRCGAPWSRKAERIIHYLTLLENQICSMFECRGMDYNLFRQVERCFSRWGICGAGKLKDGTVYADVATLGGNIDVYGYGTDGLLITRNGKEEIKGKVGTDIVVGWNNSERVPNFDILRYADMLSEVDKSIRNNVVWARAHGFPLAKDQNQKTALDKMIKSLSNDDDDVYTVINKESFAETINNDTHGIDVMRLTDVRDIDRVQYLSKLHEDLLKRWWSIYGHDMQASGKMAQQTTMELAGYASYSMIMPFDMLKCRQEWALECNRVLGTNWEYDFSPAWGWSIRDQKECDCDECREEEEAEEDEKEDIKEIDEQKDVE